MNESNIIKKYYIMFQYKKEMKSYKIIWQKYKNSDNFYFTIYASKFKINKEYFILHAKKD